MASATPILDINGLDVFYGRAHALQNIALRFESGVLAVVGRNGMGKTTLCNAITGLVPSAGSIKLAGTEIRGLTPNRIADIGIGYVPQGRRVWPSLTVDEHLRLVAKHVRGGEWTIKRIYELFPRLAERRRNGGAQLSGGEQQMLAIGRALLLNPKLLVMDEPTEGLAPVIVDQVASMLARLAHEGAVSVLLVEQNLGVAVDVADQVAIMVNGRIARIMPAVELARDTALQQRLLGVRASGDADEEASAEPQEAWDDGMVEVLTIRRANDSDLRKTTTPSVADAMAAPAQDRPRPRLAFTQWNTGNPLAQSSELRAENVAARIDATEDDSLPLEESRESASIVVLPVAATTRSAAYVAGTFDTKGRELMFMRNCLDRAGIRTITVDLSTSGKPSLANVSPAEVARHHPKGAAAVFTNDRGSAVGAMAVAFERFIASRRDVGGLISAGGSGGTTLATQAMRRLPIGVPKVMVSTVASGDVKAYVGPADICMMYAVTDVSGINRISEQVLSNAAYALAGMLANRRNDGTVSTKPAIGLTMFGVTTPCVQAVAKQLEDRFDCLTFHATGTGGQSMEKLVASGLLSGVIDITTTEVADEFVGGVFSAGPDRFESIIQSKVPYVGSCGALDMVNFHAKNTVPEKFSNRNLYVHNQNVTLMRTTPEENAAMGAWIAAKLNRMDGPVRFLIPEGGVSLIDAPDKPFWDPVANNALFSAIESHFRPSSNRRLIRSRHNINDPEFADLLVKHFQEIMLQPSAAVAAR
jgi:uncharacterized protein (UPF0261 family)/ABC-type branched-subunit amino acid transport system ATPase component